MKTIMDNHTLKIFRKVGVSVKKVISNHVLLAEYHAVYKYVIILCKSDKDAEDITQETFLKAMTNYSKFQGKSSLYTWLCSIAKNIWLNNWKKSNRENNNCDLEKTVANENFENYLVDIVD